MSKPNIKARKAISPIWIVPIAALLIGAWMVVHAYQTRGPEVAIAFATAEGIEVGKTKVRLRAVNLGTVESVELDDDLEGVIVKARLERFASDYLREDTQFWVVKPKLGPSGVSGLSTLLSGPYIEMSPGRTGKKQRAYRGLDDMPVTPPTAAGLHIILSSPKAATLSAGKPVLYRGYTVGRVETATLDPESGGGRYGLFINAPYDSLVTTSTRFWNASGISLDLNADGLSLKTESLEALIAGGVAFDLPTDAKPGAAVPSNSEFELFADYNSINRHPFNYHQDYVLLFDTSVRGLSPGAPVQYRGVRVGSVIGVSFDYVQDDTIFGPDGHIRVPVLIRLDPGRINISDTEAGREEFAQIIAEGVKSGLRATLKSGNLVTGRLYVALDFYDDVGHASMKEHDGYTILPTESSGLEQIEHKVAALLDKLQELPLDSTMDRISETVKTAGDALHSVDAVLKQSDTTELPGTVNATLTELKQTLEGFAPGSPVYDDLQRTLENLNSSLAGLDELTRTLNAQPSALVFSKPRRNDPEPGEHLE
ncbi:MAG: intermembrane transport protein PqiB [Woeseiaceae bacterium]|nr:intermembrane transport protein PqiB [Woeseiaceae bacterium]